MRCEDKYDREIARHSIAVVEEERFEVGLDGQEDNEQAESGRARSLENLVTIFDGYSTHLLNLQSRAVSDERNVVQANDAADAQSKSQ